MIQKTLVNISSILLFIVSFSINAANDTIQTTDRFIPENFRENYQGKDYQYEKSDPSWLIELKMWLLQKAMSFFQYFNYNRGVQDFKIVFYFLVAFIAIYIIAKMLLYKEGRWLFKRQRKDNTTIYQDDVEAIEVSDFEVMIKDAFDKEDYRLAVKFFYLWSLQKLAKNELIELSNLKTNYDYQLEMEDHSLYDRFKTISYYYTYVWYGEFSVDKTAFDQIEIKYNEFFKELAS